MQAGSCPSPTCAGTLDSAAGDGMTLNPTYIGTLKKCIKIKNAEEFPFHYTSLFSRTLYLPKGGQKYKTKKKKQCIYLLIMFAYAFPIE